MPVFNSNIQTLVLWASITPQLKVRTFYEMLEEQEQ